MKINWEENLIEFLFDFKISNNKQRIRRKGKFHYNVFLFILLRSLSNKRGKTRKKIVLFIKYNSSRKLRSFIQFSELLLIHRAVRKLKNYF